MHRSGTSWLAHALILAGADGGPRVHLMRAADNIRGFWEEPRAVRVNDTILRASGGAWDNPPRRMVGSTVPRDVLEQIDEGFTGACRIYKDPRLSLTFSKYGAWFDMLVAPIRHPMAVARSLERRNGMPVARGLELWKTYNTSLQDMGCRFVQFPGQQGIARLVYDLELTQTDTDMFPGIIHHDAEAAPDEYEDLYQEITAAT